MNLSKSVLAMLLTSDVWTVYGIVSYIESSCSECFSSLKSSVPETSAAMHLSTLISKRPTTISSIKSASTPVISKASSSTLASLLTATTYPLAPTAKPTKDLNTGVKIGIGVAAGVLGIVLLIVALEACYLRKKGRERALHRAVDEVESGMDKGGEERIVLESRVSIVFEDEDQEEEGERGRSGMSLQRRG